jgi:histidinol-phosphate aminotransferase
VVFVVHPNSPTGNCLTPEEINWLGHIPAQVLVVIDEAYFEFSQTTLVGQLNQHPNWVILRTFSKAFRLATHRVGYAIASPEIITVLEKIRLPYNLPAFSQCAAKLALENRDLILPSVTKIIQERERLYDNFKQNSRLKVWPSDANFIYLRLGNNSTAENLNQIIQNLKQQGTLIRHTGGGLRITIGTEAENNRLIQRLTKVLISGSSS